MSSAHPRLQVKLAKYSGILDFFGRQHNSKHLATSHHPRFQTYFSKLNSLSSSSDHVTPEPRLDVANRCHCSQLPPSPHTPPLQNSVWFFIFGPKSLYHRFSASWFSFSSISCSPSMCVRLPPILEEKGSQVRTVHLPTSVVCFSLFPFRVQHLLVAWCQRAWRTTTLYQDLFFN